MSRDILYTYENMMEDLQVLQKQYKDWLRIRDIKKTPDGRSVMEAVMGDDYFPVHILIQSSIHGREFMNTKLAMKQLSESLKHYDSGIYRDVCFHILPMVNPDGVVISQFGIHGIHKKCLRDTLMQCCQTDIASGQLDKQSCWKRWKANARGVDLNRNFNSGWMQYHGTERPSSERYKGECPESEPEVQAILEIHRRFSLSCVISYHSAGNVVYWDYGSQGEIYEADRKLAYQAASVTGYEAVSSVQGAQDGAGCSDYFVLECGIPAITIENGQGTCPLPEEEFSDIWKANEKLWPMLADICRR